MSNGVLSDTPPTYYAQADGSSTTTDDAAAGKLVYKGSDGKLTTDTTSKAESTSDPLAALDDAISQIDKFRSSSVPFKPSGFRSHQPEQHHYQPVRSAVPYSGRRLCDRSVQYVESADHPAGRQLRAGKSQPGTAAGSVSAAGLIA